MFRISSALILCLPLTVLAQEPTFEVRSNLKLGVAKVDITPAKVENYRVAGHVRDVTGVRDPLRAGVLLLDDGKTRAAIVTLDVIGAWNEMVEQVREAIATRTETPAEHILVAASHNHSGPAWKDNPAWAQELVTRLSDASAWAAADMREVSVGYAEDEIDFGINRRGVVNGKALVRLNPEGPNDPRVKILRFDDGRSLTPAAVLMHAVCHPCFFTWGDDATRPYPNGYPRMSADFPGEAQTFVEKCYDRRTSALFLQGCAGDIRPNLPGDPYRCADEADIQWAGRSLGGAVVRGLARSMVREQRRQRPEHYKIRCASKTVMLPGKKRPVMAELMAMKIGPYLLLTMPGEPMVEYGMHIEKTIADRAVPIVVGYANGHLGYIATAASHKVGGYEPNRSPLAPEAEAVIYRELDQLADVVIGDVFEAFSKHAKDVEQRKAQEAAEKK